MSSYPWHHSQWNVLQQRKERKQLPHALLLVGTSGVGKGKFAELFSQSLLCSSPTQQGLNCGLCKHCLLITAGTHPDLVFIQPESPGKAIKVDQIRALIDFSAKTSQLGSYKIIIIHPADALNIHASNALLKTLEEPTDQTLIILITNRLMALPATIRSRCSMITFPVPHQTIAIEWLRTQNKAIPDETFSLLLSLSHGAPLKALALLEENDLDCREKLFKEWKDFHSGQLSLVTLAQQWQQRELLSIFDHLASWVTDIIRLKQGGQQEHILNRDLMHELQSLGKTIETHNLFLFLDELNKAQSWIKNQNNLNPQLLVESLLIQWKTISKQKRAYR